MKTPLLAAGLWEWLEGVGGVRILPQPLAQFGGAFQEGEAKCPGNSISREVEESA